MEIQSHSHPYSVEEYPDLAAALADFKDRTDVLCLVDQNVLDRYREDILNSIPVSKIFPITASEEQKSFERLAPVFLWLLENGLRRDGCLIVIGGGVLQDIGCFIASVLFRGLRWELVPTTLLAQCDSCIGSKSSINIHSYKNQIGTFYSPHRVRLTTSVLATLPSDEIRSGLGEAIKLHLLTSETDFQNLMADLSSLPNDQKVLGKWIWHSLAIKKKYIEQDEFDRGVRNLLNYGHTFGHAYESASAYGIPHGIAVTLGMLTATYVSMKMNWVERSYYEKLKAQLTPWYAPYQQKLKTLDLAKILSAIQRDKKNTRNAVNCILTRGAGRMEKTPVDLEGCLHPALREFMAAEC